MANLEKRILQATVCLASLVPILGGGAGMIFGPIAVGGTALEAIGLESHVRYLSGLLLAIGLAFVSTVPGIEKHGRRFFLLTCLIVAGGIGRLISLLSVGLPPRPMLAALVMELIVTPALAVWQWHFARRGTAQRA